MAYKKQNFTSGQVLEAEHLNNMEAGIVANETAIAEKQPKGDYATKDYVVGKINEAALGGGDGSGVDLSAYYTKSETDDAIEQAVNGIEIPEPDLSAYPTKQEVADGYQTKGDYMPGDTKIPTKVSELTNDRGYLTEHQKLKTINGQSLVGTGNIVIEGGSIVNPTVDYEFKADVYMIPCYGQSLAVNTSAGTSTFNYVEPLCYDTNLDNSNVQDMCAGTVEAFRIMADHYGITIPENFKIVVCKDGAGGKSVTQLSKGTTYYNSLLDHVRTAKAKCDAKGLTMIVPCFTWTQGEEDMRCGGSASNYGYGEWNPNTYKNRLKQLIEDLNADIKAITGQKEDVLCISYQLASHTSYYRYPRIAFQLQELAEEYDKMVMAKVMYDLDYVTEGGLQVHAYARSYRNIGNLYGVAAFKACVLNERKRWCYPIDYAVKGNKVTIRFDTPFAPLVLDTELINQLPDGNYGFNIYNVVEAGGNSGSSITEADTKITNVQLRGDDTIELYLSRTPVVGETLTYGVNGDYWQNVNGVKTVSTGGEGQNGIAKSGWKNGARGCLRDSQPFKNNNSGATFHDLYNWCVLFEIPFTNDILGGGTSGGDDSGEVEPVEKYTFTVNATPANAVVVLNGRESKYVSVAEGTTVNWSVSAEGYATQSGSQLVDKDTSIDVTLSALKKYKVTINTVPEDALAIIEDDEIKTVDLYEGTVVDWVVSKEGYVTKTGSFTLTEDTVMTVELVASEVIDPEPEPEPVETYTLTINPTPSDAVVTLNGEETKYVQVAKGTTVDWSVSAEGYTTRTGSVTLTEDTTLTVELRRAGEMDADAEAYLTAANITDATMRSKVDTLVTSLKSEGLWDKIDALYPVIGSDFGQMRYNLKNPETYRLRTTGSPTVVEDTSFYCDKQVASDYPDPLPGTDFHVVGCSGTARADLTSSAKLLCPAPSAGSGMNDGVLMLIQPNSVTFRAKGGSWTANNVSIDGTELYIGSLTSGIVCNGNDMNAKLSGAPSFNDDTNCIDKCFQHNCYNAAATNAGLASDPFAVRLSGFGKALTIAEMQKYSQILNAFKSVY